MAGVANNAKMVLKGEVHAFPGRHADISQGAMQPVGVAARTLFLTVLTAIILVAFIIFTFPPEGLSISEATYRRLISTAAPDNKDPPIEQLLVLEDSAHSCTEAEAAVDRVCTYSQLILWKGKLHYITQDPSSLDVPLVDTLYLQWDKTHAEDRAGLFGVGHGIKAVPRGRLPWGTGTVKARVVDGAYLWNLRMGNNVGHALAEDVLSLHNSLCKHSGSCTYAERAQQQVVLLDDSRVLPVVRETIELCMSRGKVRTLHEWEKLASSSSSKGGLTVLRGVTVGVGPDCRANGDCRPPFTRRVGKNSTAWRETKRSKRMTAADMQGWRQRIGECFGFDATAMASTDPVRVVIINRLYESARAFLNIHSIKATIAHMLPQAEIEGVVLELLPLPQQFLAVSSASILVMMHGAALGFWPFLPRNAVAIHVIPHPGSDSVHGWGHRLAADLSFAGITMLPLTNRRPELLRYHLQQLSSSSKFTALSAPEQLALLENATCPSGPSYLWCSMKVMRRMVDLEMDLSQLTKVITAAVQELLGKSPRKPEDS